MLVPFYRLWATTRGRAAYMRRRRRHLLTRGMLFARVGRDFLRGTWPVDEGLRTKPPTCTCALRHFPAFSAFRPWLNWCNSRIGFMGDPHGPTRGRARASSRRHETGRFALRQCFRSSHISRRRALENTARVVLARTSFGARVSVWPDPLWTTRCWRGCRHEVDPTASDLDGRSHLAIARCALIARD